MTDRLARLLYCQVTSGQPEWLPVKLSDGPGHPSPMIPKSRLGSDSRRRRRPRSAQAQAPDEAVRNHHRVTELRAASWVGLGPDATCWPN